MAFMTCNYRSPNFRIDTFAPEISHSICNCRCRTDTAGFDLISDLKITLFQNLLTDYKFGISLRWKMFFHLSSFSNRFDSELKEKRSIEFYLISFKTCWDTLLLRRKNECLNERTCKPILLSSFQRFLWHYHSFFLRFEFLSEEFFFAKV